jgi:hypothetical protein
MFLIKMYNREIREIRWQRIKASKALAQYSTRRLNARLPNEVGDTVE